MNYIEIENLRFSYNGRKNAEILKGISLQIKQGHIFGFLGPNGAGKTTTIKTILGLIPKYFGTVNIFGQPPYTMPPKQRIGYMPEIANYYWYLTPKELLNAYAKIFHINRKERKERIGKLLELVDLKEHVNKLKF